MILIVCHISNLEDGLLVISNAGGESKSSAVSLCSDSCKTTELKTRMQSKLMQTAVVKLSTNKTDQTECVTKS